MSEYQAVFGALDASVREHVITGEQVADDPTEFKHELFVFIKDIPAIVAAELQRLMDEAFPDEDSDYHYGCEHLLELIRDRIPALCGESGADT